MAMEYLEGFTLKHMIWQPLETERLLIFVIEIADALDAAKKVSFIAISNQRIFS